MAVALEALLLVAVALDALPELPLAPLWGVELQCVSTTHLLRPLAASAEALAPQPSPSDPADPFLWWRTSEKQAPIGCW